MSNTATIEQPGNKQSRLSPEQVAIYRREGYLVLREPVLPESEFDALKAHFEQKLAELPADIRPEQMSVPHFRDTKLFRWLFADSILDLVESIIGPDIALFASHFICKPRGDGKRVPWHEDCFYWKTSIDPVEVVTVWLAIDPSTAANGAMKVIPRSLGGQSEYEAVEDTGNVVFGNEIKKTMRDDSKAVTIELAPNQASLHDCRLIHGSDANTSNLRRCGYTMRYIPTHVKSTPGSEKIRNLYLARGKDKAGNVLMRRSDRVVRGAEATLPRKAAERCGH